MSENGVKPEGTLRQRGKDNFKVIFGISAIMILAVFAVYMFLAHITGKALSKAVEGFKSGKVTTEFHDYVSTIKGNNALWVASLKSVDTFTRRDKKTYFWDMLSLPDVVVEIKVPVEYNYYVSLKDGWKFEWDDQKKSIIVTAPLLYSGTPAPDISNMEIYERENSIFRDAEKVRAELKSEISARLLWAADEKIPLVRETARKEIASFIRDWFIRFYFKDSAQKPEYLTILFSDESVQKSETPAFDFRENINNSP